MCVCTQACTLAHKTADILELKLRQLWATEKQSQALRRRSKCHLSRLQTLEFCGDFHESVESFGEQFSSILIFPIHERGRPFGFLLFSPFSLFCVSKFYLCWSFSLFRFVPSEAIKGPYSYSERSILFLWRWASLSHECLPTVSSL